MNSGVIRYLVHFLVGADCLDKKNGVSYSGCDPKDLEGGVIIRPSGFFDEGMYGTPASLPRLPLPKLEGMPVLFGEPEVEFIDGKAVIHADLIASAYFLLSRYEEYARPGIRDAFGRFRGKDSLPYRAGFLDRPVVDEYGRYLRGLLRKPAADTDLSCPEEAALCAELPDDNSAFSAIHLTHDIDSPWEPFGFWKAIRRSLGILKREHRIAPYPLLNWLGDVRHDPVFTFPWMIEQDQEVREHYPNLCRSIYFVKSGGTLAPADGFIYIRTRAFRRLLEQLLASGAEIGYHASFEAGANPSRIGEELRILEQATGIRPGKVRSHYLCSREPRDMRKLLEAGLTDDFTMGYPDRAGFRLGTSRCVRWIDPEACELTELRLHPLTVMEETLFEEQYMDLSEEGADTYADRLIRRTFENGGELNLLWHNLSLADVPGNASRNLYRKIVGDLCEETWEAGIRTGMPELAHDGNTAECGVRM